MDIPNPFEHHHHHDSGSILHELEHVKHELEGYRKQITDLEDRLRHSVPSNAIQELAHAFSQLSSTLAPLQRSADAVETASKSMTPMAKAALSAAGTVAPQLASRAKDIAARAAKYGSLGASTPQEVLSQLDVVRRLSADCGPIVKRTFAAIDPSSLIAILSALSSSFQGDGVSYRANLGARATALRDSFSDACKRRGAPFPASADLCLKQINVCLTKAPAKTFEVLSIVAPLEHFDGAKLALDKVASVKLTASKSADDDARDRLAWAIRLKCAEQALQGIVVVLPASMVASASFDVGVKEKVDAGADAGVEGEGNAAVAEQAKLELEVSYLSWSAATFGSVATILGIIAVFFEMELAVGAMKETR